MSATNKFEIHESASHTVAAVAPAEPEGHDVAIEPDAAPVCGVSNYSFYPVPTRLVSNLNVFQFNDDDDYDSALGDVRKPYPSLALLY